VARGGATTQGPAVGARLPCRVDPADASHAILDPTGRRSIGAATAAGVAALIALLAIARRAWRTPAPVPVATARRAR
jgi:hypothetical protein